MPSAVPPRRPADPRLVRVASRLAMWAFVALGGVVLFGIAGWKGWTAFAFVCALALAIAAGVVFLLAAFTDPRR